MNVDSRRGLKLSLAQKLSRLAVRLRDPEWRRYGGTLLAGKVLGVGLVLAIMAVVSAAFFTHVYAQTGTPEVKGADIVNPAQHGLDAGRRLPGVRHAGRLHHAGSRLLPLP